MIDSWGRNTAAGLGAHLPLFPREAHVGMASCLMQLSCGKLVMVPQRRGCLGTGRVKAEAADLDWKQESKHWRLLEWGKGPLGMIKLGRSSVCS